MKKEFMLCLAVFFLTLTSSTFAQIVPTPVPQFPLPPARPTHVAIVNGSWNQTTTWGSGTVPGNQAIVRIPSGLTVTVDSQENTNLRFVEIIGHLKMATNVNTRLKFETMIVSQAGFLEVGSAATPIRRGLTAELIVRSPNSPISISWDPDQMSRGLLVFGKIRFYGAAKEHMMEMSVDASKAATNLDLGVSVPLNWSSLDEVVLTGTHFARFQPLEDEVLTISNLSGSTFDVSPALINDHIKADVSMNMHVANLTRNIVVKSAFTTIMRRGHVMMRTGSDVELVNARFEDLGRTNKNIPLDDIDVSVDSATGKWVVTAKSPATILNRRARYPVHFHQNGTLGAAQSKVFGCVVKGTPGWGFVNHGSNVDFQKNVCYDFVGSGFVTETGTEIGNFFDNIAIHGTGVIGDANNPLTQEYFFVRQVFESANRPQALSDFGFGGDGFWFQGPAIRVRNNVANSCNGTGMFWFTTGAPNPEPGPLNKYSGIPIADVTNIYGQAITTRTWAHSGEAVIADLPILEMDGFQGSACLVGFRLRFCNGDVLPLYNEMNLTFASGLQGSAVLQRHDLKNIKVWNNEQGFRTRYTNNADWLNVTNINVGRYNLGNLSYVGAEFNHVTFSQTFTNLTISGYAVAGLIRSYETSSPMSPIKDNSSQITFNPNPPNYLNYVSFDTKLDPTPRVDSVVSGVTAQRVTISWNHTPSAAVPWPASRFLLRYRVQGTNEWSFATQPNGSIHSLVLSTSALLPSTIYEYQVVVSANDTTAPEEVYVANWISTKTFTTLP